MSSMPEKRVIRIFISSTFEDMKAERDYLITKIFPQLAAKAAERDVSIIPLDLRWGISEEEACSGKVIEICLNEIEHSRPFFIGLLGNRYGWCPPQEELQKNALLRERYDWIEGDIAEGRSVTEMEIQYGVLRNPENIDAFFYIRNNGQPDGENPAKLLQLKDAVRQNKRYPVSDYRTVEELGTMIESAFSELLDKRFPNHPLSNLERERLAQLTFLHHRCEVYRPQAAPLSRLNSFLQAPDEHQLVLTGESGVGKSALIANWLLPLLDNKEYHIIYHFTGYGELEGHFQHIAQRICEEIRDLYQLPQEAFPSSENKKVEDELQYLLSTVAHRKPLLIVLDGLNQLADEGNGKQMLWLPPATGNIKYLFSTLPDDRTMEVFTHRKYPVLTLLPMPAEDRRQLVGIYLKRYGKKLTPVQINRIITAPQCENTLVLCTLLDELIGFGSYELLDSRIDYYLSASSPEDFFQRVLQRFEDDFGEPLVRRLLTLIAFSRSGLSEQELLAMTGLPVYHWSQFYCAFRPHLTSRGGLLTFSHSYIRSAVHLRYKTKGSEAVKVIAAFFEQTPHARRFDELPYQYSALGKYHQLYRFLLNPQTVSHFRRKKDEFLLGTYWKKLIEHDSDTFSPQAYLQLEGEKEEQAACFHYLGHLFSSMITDYPLALLLQKAALSLYQKLADSPGITKENRENYLTKLVLCYYSIGYTLNALGKYDLVLDAYHLAFKTEKEIFGTEYLGSATYHNAMGCLLGTLGKYDEALEHLETALKLCTTTCTGETLETATCYLNIGTIYYQHKGAPQQALSYIERALVNAQANLGGSHPFVADCYNSLGSVHRTLKAYDTALLYLEKGAIARALFYGENHPKLAESYNSLGLFYNEQGRFEDAIEFYEQSLRISKHAFKLHHPTVANRYYNLAIAYYSWGQQQEKTYASHQSPVKGEWEKEIFSSFEEDFPNPCDTTSSYSSYEKALECARQAAEIYSTTLGPNHPFTQEALELTRRCEQKIKNTGSLS